MYAIRFELLLLNDISLIGYDSEYYHLFLTHGGRLVCLSTKKLHILNVIHTQTVSHMLVVQTNF